MNAAKFRRCLPRHEEELILNVCYGENEDYRVLAMAARTKDRLYMWEISAVREDEDERKRRRFNTNCTNREMQKTTFNNKVCTFIREIVIDGQSLCVSSVMGSDIGENWNDDKKVLLFYLLQKGVRLGELEDVPFEKLCINEYELYEQENGQPYEDKEPAYYWKIPADKKGDISVTVQLDSQHVPVPVHKRLTLKQGEYKRPRVIKLPGDENAEIYIHRVNYYDAWEEEKTRFDNPRYKQFSEEQLENMRQRHMETLEKTCKKGRVIPLVEYECNKDYQVQFYTLEYLRRKHESSSSGTIMMFSPDEKTGPLGFRNRACALEAVPADFLGNFKIELFMYYKYIPPMTMECKNI